MIRPDDVNLPPTVPIDISELVQQQLDEDEKDRRNR